eukprot:450725-Hanusia_phi.AAC.1
MSRKGEMQGGEGGREGAGSLHLTLGWMKRSLGFLSRMPTVVLLAFSSGLILRPVSSWRLPQETSTE